VFNSHTRYDILREYSLWVHVRILPRRLPVQ